jgi:hypothetical protein
MYAEIRGAGRTKLPEESARPPWTNSSESRRKRARLGVLDLVYSEGDRDSRHLAELRGVLLAEHEWRVREGLV